MKHQRGMIDTTCLSPYSAPRRCGSDCAFCLSLIGAMCACRDPVRAGVKPAPTRAAQPRWVGAGFIRPRRINPRPRRTDSILTSPLESPNVASKSSLAPICFMWHLSFGFRLTFEFCHLTLPVTLLLSEQPYCIGIHGSQIFQAILHPRLRLSTATGPPPPGGPSLPCGSEPGGGGEPVRHGAPSTCGLLGDG